MPSVTIESEVRPYLNSLIENGASFFWLQRFYQEKINQPVAEAINKIQAASDEELILLLRLFIDNQAISYPDKHQKLMPIRLLFRHSDILTTDLQNKLSREIFLKFAHAPNCFLEQDAEKILENLLNLQILLEMRNRIKNNKNTIYPPDWSDWLKKEIHSRVPVTQRKIQTYKSKDQDVKQKWHFSKGQFGYYSGPGSIWYFFNGETKLVRFFQREYLALIIMALTLKDAINQIASQKFSMGKIFLYTLAFNGLFLLQIVNIFLMPYRFFKTALNQIDQTCYHFFRNQYEYFFPLRHGPKPLFYTLSFLTQLVLYAGLFLTAVPTSSGIAFSSINFFFIEWGMGTVIGMYNIAILGGGSIKMLYDYSLKMKIKILEKPYAKSSAARVNEKTVVLENSKNYTPSMNNKPTKNKKPSLQQANKKFQYLFLK